MRAAASDFYFNSLRLVPINLMWGLGVIATALVALVWPVGALGLGLLLAVPGAAVVRMAAAIVRGEPEATFSDAIMTSLRSAGSVLLVAVGLLGAATVLGTNAVIGLTQTGPLGWAIGTLAAWGLITLWCTSIVLWPLLVDPLRVGQPLRMRLRTTAMVLLSFPVRSAALGILIGLIATISAVLVVGLLSVGLALLALVACRAVYPVADRIDRLAGPER